MVKKKAEHGPLYEHAKAELERAGISGGKGNMDQKVYHTVLKLVDTYERASASELLANTIGNLFATLSQGEIINSPTDDPDEWKLMPGLGEGVMVLRRCNAFRSRDGGVTWYREDTGASGVSSIATEDKNDASEESTEDVQPAKS
jgi:hypothetical protein